MPKKIKKNKVIEIENLTVGYNDVVVLKNISFSISEGEIFIVLGGSGCGKSTLLKNIIGLYEPMAGSVKIMNSSLHDCTEQEQIDVLRKFGVTYQEGALFGSMTLAENIALPLEEFTDLSKKEIAGIVEKKLELVDLGGFGEYMPGELSGGMKKRAGVARALALEPDILFFDEPSAGLDPITSADLDSLIRRLRDNLGTTIMIVSHELDSIFSIADRVVLLDKKSKGIIAEGTPYDLLENSKDPYVIEFLSRKGMKRENIINRSGD